MSSTRYTKWPRTLIKLLVHWILFIGTWARISPQCDNIGVSPTQKYFFTWNFFTWSHSWCYLCLFFKINFGNLVQIMSNQLIKYGNLAYLASSQEFGWTRDDGWRRTQICYCPCPLSALAPPLPRRHSPWENCEHMWRVNTDTTVCMSIICVRACMYAWMMCIRSVCVCCMWDHILRHIYTFCEPGVLVEVSVTGVRVRLQLWWKVMVLQLGIVLTC